MRIGDWSSDVCSSDLDFCKRFPAECSETAQSGGPVVLDDARWAQLDAVNSDVNRNIHYVADSRTFDRSEYWTLPQGQGDCEDLALEKRRRLIAMGWPRESLLIALANVPRVGGHAVRSAGRRGGKGCVSTCRSRWAPDH